MVVRGRDAQPGGARPPYAPSCRELTSSWKLSVTKREPGLLDPGCFHFWNLPAAEEEYPLGDTDRLGNLTSGGLLIGLLADATAVPPAVGPRAG